MSTQVGGISIVIEDNLGRFMSSMKAAGDATEQSGRRMNAAVTQAEGSINKLNTVSRAFAPDAFRSLSISALRAKNDVEGLKAALLSIPALGGGFGGAIAVQQLVQRADGYTNLKNRIASVVEGSRDQISAEQDLFAVAQKTRTALQANASLFARLRSSSPELAADPEKLLRTVETVQKSFNVAGSTTQEAQSSALQLAQALGSGRLQGDELRSILENNIPLAKLIAKEFGVGIGQLKTLGSEGLLTSDRVVKAILDGSSEIDATFKRLKPTIESSVVVLSNALTRSIGKLDEATGASAGLAGGIMSVANNLDSVGTAALAAGALLASAFLGRGAGAIASNVKGDFDDQKALRAQAVQNAQDATAEARRNLGSAYEAAYAKREKAIKVEADALKRLNDQATNNLQGQIALQNKADQIRQRIADGRIKDEKASSASGIALAEKQQVALDKAAQARTRVAQAEEAYQKKAAQEVQPDRSKLTGLYDAQFERAQRQDELRRRQAAFDEAKARRDAFATNYGDPSSEVGKRYGGEIVQRQFDIAGHQRTAALQRYYDSEERFRAESVRADAIAEKQKTAAVRSEIREREAAKRSLATAEKQAADSLALTPGGQKTSAQSLSDLKALAKAEADLNALKKQSNLIGTAQVLQSGQVAAAQGARGATPELASALDAYKKSLDNVTAAKAGNTTASATLGAAWRTLSAVGSSLFAFVGGPWGAALTVASLGFAAYQYSVANAAAESERFKANAEGIPDLLQRISQAGQSAGNSLKAQANASLVTAVAAQADATSKAVSEVNRVSALAGNDGVRRLNDELGIVPSKGQSAEQAFRGFVARALESESGTKSVITALERLGATSIDLSQPVSEALRVVAAMAGARAQVNALRDAIAGASNRGASPKFDYTDDQLAEQKINAANKQSVDYAQTTTDLVDQQNRKLEVQAGIARRIADAGRDKRDGRRDELKDQILADSRRSGAGLSDDEALKSARQIEAIEKATADAQKKGRSGGGGSGRKGFTPEERFENKVDLIKQEGRASFFSDLDRQLISQLREIKSDPDLAERTVNALKSGSALPERAQQLRDALEQKRAGELARDARDQYGSLADVLPLVAERQRVLNIAVREGQITQEVANTSVQRYAQTLPQLQSAMAIADGLSSSFERAFNTAIENPKKAGQALKQFGLDLIKIGNQQFVFDPLKKGLRDLLTTVVTTAGSGKGGGVLGILGSIFGLGGGGAILPAGASISGGGVVPLSAFSSAGAFFHGGGIVGDGRATVPMPSSLFTNAPRHHSGLKTNEFAAILERGEAVATGQQQRGIAKMVDSANSLQSVSNVTFAPVIDARGADAGAVARMERGLVEFQKSLPRNVNAIVNRSQTRRNFS